MAATLGLKAHPLQKLWHHYELQLQRRPLVTNMATSAVLWAAGDVLAQKCANKDKPLEWRRTVLTGVFGGSFIGPCGHYWYDHILDWLVAFFGQPGSMRSIMAKVFLDNTLYSSFYMLAFFAFGELVLDKGSWAGLVAQLKTEFLPTYVAEVCAWPPIMFAIFSKLPSQYHLLAVNLLCVLDVAFLAVIRSGAGSLNDIRKPSTSSQTAANKKASQPRKQQQKPKKAPQPSLPERPAYQHDPLLLPALASVHSGNIALDWGSVYGRLQQVVDAWVQPLHKV